MQTSKKALKAAVEQAIENLPFTDDSSPAVSFTDKACLDEDGKNCISIRDGYQEYMGMELGLEPPEKIFKVYRSPDTIASIKAALDNLPVTDEHIKVDIDVSPDIVKGIIEKSEIVKTPKEIGDSVICVRNKLRLTDEGTAIIASGKRELSLGYTANLKPHSEYDFEQVNIRPHHLAIVSQGRCGAVCSFNDKKGKEPMSLHQVFTDEAGAANLSRIVEIAQALPEAIKTIPIDKLQELLPALEEAIKMAKAGDESEVEEKPDEPEMQDMEAEEDKAEMGDMEGKEEETEDEKPAYNDAAVVELAKKMANERYNIIDKAREFLGDSYSFADKSNEQIMRDTLAAESKQEFADSELSVAFKLLKKTATYDSFGSQHAQAASPYKRIGNKEI